MAKGEPSFSVTPDTVAIVGLNGLARKTATFAPRKGPYMGNVAVLLPDVAVVNAQGVYYIDGFGTVRLLQVGAEPRIVASFPQTPDQHETWFAVSPDGSRFVAGVLTFPAIGPTPSGVPWPSLVGPWKFDLESATGGKTTLLAHWDHAASGR
ncbi:MAG TPA: hypothetical protein VK131_01625 [Candidatus Acidoferrales bacterium]|nr:hypothetical protein [Candidatus Acidoferrales bacterium]